MTEKIRLRNGDTMLIMVEDGAVIHFTANMSLPQSSSSGVPPARCPKAPGSAASQNSTVKSAITSKHFFGYQLPAPPEVRAAVLQKFE